jgi:hypothetical protein
MKKDKIVKEEKDIKEMTDLVHKPEDIKTFDNQLEKLSKLADEFENLIDCFKAEKVVKKITDIDLMVINIKLDIENIKRKVFTDYKDKEENTIFTDVKKSGSPNSLYKKTVLKKIKEKDNKKQGFFSKLFNFAK